MRLLCTPDSLKTSAGLGQSLPGLIEWEESRAREVGVDICLRPYTKANAQWWEGRTMLCTWSCMESSAVPRRGSYFYESGSHCVVQTGL